MFSDLISDKNVPLRFDFAIINDDQTVERLIEYDGEQHYLDKTNEFWKRDNLTQRQAKDSLKNIYCNSHGLKLVRIPYWEKNNISLNMLMGDQYLI